MAGIVVSKNGLFAPPAIIGYVIGTVDAGPVSTLQITTSSAKWIGYEVLPSLRWPGISDPARLHAYAGGPVD